jgi:hypothetical protein
MVGYKIALFSIKTSKKGIEKAPRRVLLFVYEKAAS